MPTNVQSAARLLRAAAAVFREAGERNPALKQQMDLNQRAYEAVAVLVEKDPHGQAPEPDDTPG